MPQPQLSGAVDQANQRNDLTARPRGGPVTYGQPFDLANRLPATGRSKLVQLRQLRDDLSAVFDKALEDWNIAREDRGRALQRLTNLTDPMAAMRAGFDSSYGPDHPTVIDAQRQLDEAEARFAAITERRDNAGQKRNSLLKLIRACEDYIQAHRGEELAAYEGEPPEVTPGETAKEALERVRRERATLAADLHEVRCAPIPSSMVKARIKAEVEALAERGAPNLSHLVEFGGDIRWPDLPLHASFDGAFAFAPSPDGKSPPQHLSLYGSPRVQVIDAQALLFWAHKDAILKKLIADADAMVDDEAALTDEERADREADLLARILEMERREEAFVEALGDPFARRPEADPRAFLSII
jgi:hypothetical protein